ncbi:hypothetical protein G7046_g685 [Stylonectria norvegica]|nr:hypothetical protein G7046_g685 [Stylonectria norvegica]
MRQGGQAGQINELPKVAVRRRVSRITIRTKSTAPADLFNFMFAGFHDARTALSRPLGRLLHGQRRRASARSATRVQSNEIAQKLHQTGLWTNTRGKAKKAQIGGVDKHRVNLVNESVADDILQYVGPSLDRHRGCDLVDINPGAGVWSSKLHEYLQPRKHILMEKDADMYRPFLADLLAKDTVELVEESGIFWKSLSEMLRLHLPNQKVLEPNSIPERNDTLLVSVNLGMSPKKPFQNFDCVSTMVLYQFMSSIRTAALFQRYGLVRMLIWVSDDGKRKMLPRSIARRKRAAFEAELACEWIHEVAGKDVEVENRLELRDEWLNVESGYQTVERMKKQGLKMPAGRETIMYNKAMADPSLTGKKLAGERRPLMARPFKQEIEDLKQSATSRTDKDQVDVAKRMKALNYREKYDYADNMNYLEIIQERDAIIKLSSSDPSAFAAADEAWNAKVGALKKNQFKEFKAVRDNYHLFRQNPPALLWDQRAFEPLTIQPDDFYPQHACALFDFQPKALHPLLRVHGPKTSRAGDMSDLMVRFWLSHSMQPVSKAMDGIWPGFGQLADQIASLQDPSVGGSPMTGHGELTARCVNQLQWAEIVMAFMEWPFRPTHAQLVARLVDDHETDVDEEDVNKSPAMGGGDAST